MVRSLSSSASPNGTNVLIIHTDLATVPEDVVTQDVAINLASFSRYEVPPHLWWDPSSIRKPNKGISSTSTIQSQEGPFFRYQDDFFVSALPNATATGVFRHRAMRLNTTIDCKWMPPSEFPPSCGGDSPFFASIGRAGTTKIRVCVPGNRGVFPWQLTRDMQNITENVYIDVLGSNNTNLTRHCSASTVRGYFELGNYRNGETHGFLLDRWEEPDPFAPRSKYVLSGMVCSSYANRSVVTDTTTGCHSTGTGITPRNVSK
jgi:hypothetical protein